MSTSPDCAVTGTIDMLGERYTVLCHLPAGHDGDHDDENYPTAPSDWAADTIRNH